jgi:Coiled-coil domain-containing protein 56
MLAQSAEAAAIAAKQTARKNFVVGLLLFGFVGGVYGYTVKQMKKAEIVDVARELEEYQAAKKAAEKAGVAASASAPAGTPSDKQLK